ncbi:AAA family ATPase [Latilactobacillus curvatus]|uniref:AAA family ATPase n=1 Tax=Latilactobacillus curvatus TaxID=28038 RepID=UPI0035C681D6
MMQINDHTLILLAGAPGTGKTYTEDIIKEKMPGLVAIPLDLIKEHLYDEIGFDNPAEKRALDDMAYLRFYQAIQYLMNIEKPIIADYPFSYVQKEKLEDLGKQFDYQIITVRLEADIKVLYERAMKRDLEGPRHLGLKMNHYHRGDNNPSEIDVDGLPSFETFETRAKERGYQTFSVGKLITLDVSDYSNIEYDKFLKKLQQEVCR